MQRGASILGRRAAKRHRCARVDLLEPIGRNTAPAIALAALAEKDDPLLLILAADHVIQDQVAFTDAVAKAI